MDLQLAKKVTLVTGSTTGIGLAIAKQFTREGAYVIIHGSRDTSVRKALADLEKENRHCAGVVADFSIPNAGKIISRQLKSLHVEPDILVNNAAVFYNRQWEESDETAWTSSYQINVAAHISLIQALLPTMKRRAWGRIINISSGESTKPFAHMPDYAATKAAMNNMTVSLSKALSSTGITANTISPGIIRSQNVEGWFREVGKKSGWGDTWDEIEQGIIRDILPNNCGRIGLPEEVANLVAYVSSPLAGYINGANLRIDGGSTDHLN